MFLRTLLATLLVAAPVVSIAPAAAQPAEQGAGYAARYELGIDIAKAAYPVENSAAEVARGFIIGINHAKTADPNLAALEQQYPGIIDEFAADGAAITAASVERRLPELWSALANLYAREISLEEVRALHGFYTSPTGRKLLTSMNEHVDLDSFADQVLSDGGISMQTQGMAAVDGEMKARAQMSAEEQAAIESFIAAHQATLGKITPQAMTITNNFMNAPLPKEDEQKMGAVIRQLIAKRAGAGATEK